MLQYSPKVPDIGKKIPLFRRRRTIHPNAAIDEFRCIIVSQERDNRVAYGRTYPVNDPRDTKFHTAGTKIRKDVQKVRAVFHSDNRPKGADIIMLHA